MFQLGKVNSQSTKKLRSGLSLALSSVTLAAFKEYTRGSARINEESNAGFESIIGPTSVASETILRRV